MVSSPASPSRGTTTPAPLSHYNGQGVRERWPVLVYRLQSHRGWEIYSDPDREASASASADRDRECGANANARAPPPAGVEELTAAPRRGCIEVRKMRLRIQVRRHGRPRGCGSQAHAVWSGPPAPNRPGRQLFAQHTPWDPGRLRRPRDAGRGRRSKEARAAPSAASAGTDRREAARDGADAAAAGEDEEDDEDDDAPGADGWNNNSLVVRRDDTLLVTTRRGMGAVAFRFRSTRDCIDFCDRLTHLNREYLAPPSHAAAAAAEDAASATGERDDGYVHGMDRRERCRMEQIGAKRRCLRAAAGRGALSTALLGRPPRDVLDEEAPTVAEEAAPCCRQEELMSYVVRLAHSAEFEGFVDELQTMMEMEIETAGETAGQLAAFGL